MLIFIADAEQKQKYVLCRLFYETMHTYVRFFLKYTLSQFLTGCLFINLLIIALHLRWSCQGNPASVLSSVACSTLIQSNPFDSYLIAICVHFCYDSTFIACSQICFSPLFVIGMLL